MRIRNKSIVLSRSNLKSARLVTKIINKEQDDTILETSKVNKKVMMIMTMLMLGLKYMSVFISHI